MWWAFFNFTYFTQTMKKLIIISLVLSAACAGNTQENQEPWKEAITTYLKNPEHLNDIAMYEPLEFEAPDTLAGDTAYAVVHMYKGLNIASREVRRRAIVFFDQEWQVMGYENVEYLDPMTKAQRKGRPEGQE